MPASKLQRQSLILNDHRTMEAQTKGIIKFVHMNGNENTVNIVTKSLTSNTWSPLTKPIFYGVIWI